MTEDASSLRGGGPRADGLAASPGSEPGLALSDRATAKVLGAPPWHYAGTVVGVEFWTTPEAAARALPPALAPEDTRGAGHGYALFADWQVSGGHREYLDPVRSQYSEFLVLLDARWQDTSVAWCPYLYVDNDAALARGCFQGFPRKLGGMHQRLGRVYQTRAFPVAGQAAPSVAAGGTFAASARVAGRRLAEAAVTLERPVGELPGLEHPVVNLTHFPGRGGDRRLAEAVGQAPGGAVVEDLRVAECWTGGGTLSFLPVAGEELADLVVVRTGEGFRGSLSYTVTDLAAPTGPDADAG